MDFQKIEDINNDLEKSYGKVFNNYDIYISGTVRKFIGESLKSKRVCRFCSKKEPNTTFRQSAHAISEALGNKKVFLYEECDSCNDKFSREIEPDLIDFMTVFRSVFDIKGKGGSKKIKGKNFEMVNDGQVQLRFNSHDDRPKVEQPYSVSLKMRQKVISQDIYRCLCKFLISVVEAKTLNNFTATINWINKESSIAQLPKVAEGITYNNFTKEPHLYVYIRKSDDKRLPYAVGEFRFTCKIMVFIIPLVATDEKDFVNDSDYKYFWKTFNYYKSINWIFEDFSSEIEKELTFLLKTTIKDS